MLNYINFRQVNKLKKNKNVIIYRSASIDLYSKEDFEFILNEHNIKYWLDIRSFNEINYNKIIQSDIVHYFPLISDDIYKLPKIPNSENYFQYYIAILENNSCIIKDIFLYLSNLSGDGNVSISCYAGKDRTGIISYLLQKILDYDVIYIKNNYIKSSEDLYNNRNFFYKSSIKKGLTIEEYSQRFLICKAIFDIFDNYFFNKFFSINNYFNSIGIDDSVLTRLKKIYGEKDGL